nr:unnamed protein product [Spirometra erinaceieuropaei]
MPLMETSFLESPPSQAPQPSEGYPSTPTSQPTKQCEDLGLSDTMFQGGSETDLHSPTSGDIQNSHIRYTKHSPSDCSSAFTDEDSGCHVNCCSAAMAGSSLVACSHNHNNRGQMLRTASVSALEARSAQAFGTRDEFLAAMTEDLAEWMSRLYPDLAGDLEADNFFDRISDGTLLCHHAAQLHRLLIESYPVSMQRGELRLHGVRIGGVEPLLPSEPPTYHSRGVSSQNLAGGSFWARDNIANFIKWCRSMRLPDSILFETEDLASRKCLRSVIVCLLELARLGGRFGMEVPEIVYLEKEIDAELAAESSLPFTFSSDHGTETDDCRLDPPEAGCDFQGNTEELGLKDASFSPEALVKLDVTVGTADGVTANVENCSNTTDGPPANSESNQTVAPTPRHIYNKAAMLRAAKIKSEHPAQKHRDLSKREEEAKPSKPKYNRPVVDMRSLDEIVRDTLAECTCEQTFPMVRLSEGRYLFGDKSTQIFVRILRSHVMVRVGGGWDTLNHFLQKYDECRKVTPQGSHQHPSSDSRLNSPGSGDPVDASTPTSVLRAVGREHQSEPPETVSGSAREGALLGQGSLQVVKKGREVVRRFPSSPSKGPLPSGTTNKTVHPASKTPAVHCTASAPLLKSPQIQSGVDEESDTSSSVFADSCKPEERVADSNENGSVHKGLQGSDTAVEVSTVTGVSTTSMDSKPVFIIESPETEPEEKLKTTSSRAADTRPEKNPSKTQSSILAQTQLAPASGKYARRTQSVTNYVPSAVTSRTSLTRQLSAVSKEKKVRQGRGLGKASSISTNSLFSLGDTSVGQLQGSLGDSQPSMLSPSKTAASSDRALYSGNRKAATRRAQSTSDIAQVRPTGATSKTVTKACLSPQKTEPDVFSRLYRAPQRAGRGTAAATVITSPTTSRAKSVSSLTTRVVSTRKLSDGLVTSGPKRNPSQRQTRQQASGRKMEEAPPMLQPLAAEAPGHPFMEGTRFARPSVARMPAQGTRIPRPARQYPLTAISRSKSVSSQFIS